MAESVFALYRAVCSISSVYSFALACVQRERKRESETFGFPSRKRRRETVYAVYHTHTTDPKTADASAPSSTHRIQFSSPSLLLSFWWWMCPQVAVNNPCYSVFCVCVLALSRVSTVKKLCSSHRMLTEEEEIGMEEANNNTKIPFGRAHWWWPCLHHYCEQDFDLELLLLLSLLCTFPFSMSASFLCAF